MAVGSGKGTRRTVQLTGPGLRDLVVLLNVHAALRNE